MICLVQPAGPLSKKKPAGPFSVLCCISFNFKERLFQEFKIILRIIVPENIKIKIQFLNIL